jgi:hypothetical protein
VVTWRFVADKVHGILERTHTRPSTRYKDLVDLLAISTRCPVDAAVATRALQQESQRRGVRLPPHFDLPDRSLWQSGYPKLARRAVGLTAVSLDRALNTVRPIIDPLLDGTATGNWDPETGRWSSTTSG